jgi:hypothetical protein
MVGKRRSGRFTRKDEREVIAMALGGATAPEIAAKFKTSVKTIERKARALGISIRTDSKQRSKKLAAGEISLRAPAATSHLKARKSVA